MFSLQVPPLFAALKDSQRILIAGAGGGFDVFAGLPLAIALMDAGKEVHFANLSFISVDSLPSPVRVRPGLAAVSSGTPRADDYFPELALAKWLARNGFPDVVYAFQKQGVVPLRASYRHLIKKHDIDAVVLVDGGTDILMRGDENRLGTPEEDMASLAAAARLHVPVRLVCSLGFGIDAHHGVCHSHVLENLAALEREGGYLGALSIPKSSREGRLYLDAVEYAERLTPRQPSIVHGSVASALTGRFGNAHRNERTGSTELYINPLMAMYFTVDLQALADRNLYLDRLEGTQSIWDVSWAISEFRENQERTRPARAYPH